MKRTHLSILTAAGSTSTATACAILFPGIEVYVRNRGAFSLTPWGAAGFGVVGLLICFVVCFSVLALCRRPRVFAAANAVVLGAGISILLQYLYWSGVFPEQTFDETMPVSDMLLLAGFNLFLLLLPPAVALCCRRTLCRNAGKVAAVVVLTQFVSIVWACMNNTAGSYDFTEYTISEKTKFEFGSRENVIVLVVDAMGERIAKETMAKYPELRTVFRDFVCFDRMVSPLPRTMFAVPAMLTGVEYRSPNEDDEDEHARYLIRACRGRRSLFQALKRHGFRVEGYPFILQTISYGPDVIDNSASVTHQAQRRSAITILDAALSRQIPFFLKPLLAERYFDATDRFVTPGDAAATDEEPFDVVFLRRLKGEFRVGARERVFKYLHIQGAHDPVRTDEHLAFNRETSKLRQLRGSLKIVEMLLEKLRIAGLYDDATIVVIGDHSEFYTQENIAFVKRGRERSETLRFNSVPCKVSDIAGTVLKEVRPSENADSLFDLAPVWGDGSCRTDARVGNLRFGAWTKNAVNVEEFSPYLKTFHRDNSRLLIEPEFDCTRPAPKITLILQNAETEETWTSEVIAEPGIHPFLEVSSFDVPDGVYRLILRGSTNCESEMQCLPRFLTVAGGDFHLSETYPDLTPRAMRRGEGIVFRPLRPYPQVVFAAGTEFRGDAVILEENQRIGIRLPALRPPAELTLTKNFTALPPGKLTLYRDGKKEAEITVKEPGERNIPVMVPPGEERVVTFFFRFTPKRRSRETSPTRLRVFLSRIRLE